MDKYLHDCGFGAFVFGERECGFVDVSASGGRDVVDGVSRTQAARIIAYLSDLEVRVERHIELHYEPKGGA